jgi:hypothetical protein
VAAREPTKITWLLEMQAAFEHALAETTFLSNSLPQAKLSLAVDA